ncbi:Zinc knuckle CX2CX4HX4C [Trema orientale]|uniref:Zinc knuckle CX2CX4HX4C n=1 Tax=Trema orientale TaxID=63057 RepID=A0A2P5EER3_TREOI|nr:Zinc knuckle CX2CX4HX4C [Trema orientale]
MVPKPQSQYWGRSFRIKVEVELGKPLLAGFFLKNEFGVPQWIQLKYEKLGNFYYKCGLIDHEEKDCCPSTPAMVCDSSGRKVQLYGHWLKGVSQYVSCFAPEIQHANPMGFKPRDPPLLSTTVTMTENDPEITKHTYRHQLMQGARNLRGSTSLTSTVGQGVAGTPTAHNSQLLSDPTNSETLRETETSAQHPRASDDTIDSEVAREAQVVTETKTQNNRGGNVFVYQASAQEFNEEADFMFLPCPRHNFQSTPSTMVPPLGLSGLINVGPNYKKRKALPLMIPRIEYGRWAQGLPESLEPPSQSESINLEPRLNLEENERSLSPGPSGGNS